MHLPEDPETKQKLIDATTTMAAAEMYAHGEKGREIGLDDDEMEEIVNVSLKFMELMMKVTLADEAEHDALAEALADEIWAMNHSDLAAMTLVGVISAGKMMQGILQAGIDPQQFMGDQ